MTEVCMILAVGPVDKDGKHLIGLDDKLAWHSKLDFQFFKNTTLHYPCIFGDKTFFTLPKYPLKDRLNLVTCFDYTETAVEHNKEGSYLRVPNLEQAIELCKHYSKCFICGGGMLYKYAFEHNLVDSVYVTKVKGDVTGNRYLQIPHFVKRLEEDWYLREYDRQLEPEEHLDLEFCKYTKELK